MRNLLLGLIACGFCLCSVRGYPCTTFVLAGGDRLYFGRNLDWDWEDGLVFVNARDICKTALVAPGRVPVKWTSKYGSITFNQFGHEMPYGGMNEAGLVVENLWLGGTQYPPADARPEINMLQWIQYQLDNHRTVAEVIASDQRIRLENTAVRARLHYFVCDASGDTATIEFLNGALRVHRGENLPHRVLANDPYDWSLDHRGVQPKTDPSEPLWQADSPLRFWRAAARAGQFKPAARRAQDVAYAFATLDQVRQENTAWQIVYDIPARQIHYRTRTNPRERRIDLKALDFSCARATQFADIQANTSRPGRLPFQRLTESAHRQYVERFYGQESLKNTVGDVTPLIEPLLQTLRGYTCATNQWRLNMNAKRPGRFKAGPVALPRSRSAY